MNWNIDPILVEIGPIEIRYYGLIFAFGLLIGVEAMHRAFRRRGLPKKHAGTLTWLLPVGLIIGAHLIHLIFYEPRSFIDNPIRILEIGKGLASHGGGIGSVLALYLFCRKHRASFHEYADAGIVGAVWIIPMVRVGNFFNSEIYGRVTDVPWGVVFERHGFTEPRHPSQLYEAAVGFALVAFTIWFDRKKTPKMATGSTFYLVLFIYFLTRFFLEYVKEYQVLAASFPITMGQLLSVPIALACLFMFVYRQKHGQPAPLRPQMKDSAPAPKAHRGAPTAGKPPKGRSKPKAKAKRRKGK